MTHKQPSLGPPKRAVHWRAGLSPENVRRIRKAYASGKKSQVQLAEEFGVCQATISNLLSGKTYQGIS